MPCCVFEILFSFSSIEAVRRAGRRVEMTAHPSPWSWRAGKPGGRWAGLPRLLLSPWMPGRKGRASQAEGGLAVAYRNFRNESKYWR